jgi:hypothetical protein
MKTDDDRTTITRCVLCSKPGCTADDCRDNKLHRLRCYECAVREARRLEAITNIMWKGGTE